MSNRKRVDEYSTDMCAACDIDLATCDTIWAAEGTLYCSRECGIHDYRVVYGDNAEQHFDEVAEEIVPSQIGICRVEGGTKTECAYCGVEFDDEDEDVELHNTNFGKLCDFCIAGLRRRGESITIYEGGR